VLKVIVKLLMMLNAVT